MLPFEQRPNPYITPALNFNFPLLLHAQVLVRVPRQSSRRLSPEASARSTKCFELLTLDQTHKLFQSPITIVIYGSSYWKETSFNLETPRRKGPRSPSRISTSSSLRTRPKEAFAILQKTASPATTSTIEHARDEAPHPRTPPKPMPRSFWAPDIAQNQPARK